MSQQCFKPPETSAETLTLPANLYYRLRLLGVVLGCGVLAVLLGRITRWCRSRLDGTRLAGLMILGVRVSRIYSIDFVHALWAPVYELPIGMDVGLIASSGLRDSPGATVIERILKSWRGLRP